MSDKLRFDTVTRDELLSVLTARQVEIIDDNLNAFWVHLRAVFIAEFNGKDWDSNAGIIILYVDDRQMFMNYPTSLGHFENGRATSSWIESYIRTEQDRLSQEAWAKHRGYEK